ncbi:hypothetical protein J31TS4_23450 [Paenibacillus sp. J31TS4]|nr:hypothetical protein J31TS4_23450 [Paenibacillus sp. J31TS4]
MRSRYHSCCQSVTDRPLEQNNGLDRASLLAVRRAVSWGRFPIDSVPAPTNPARLDSRQYVLSQSSTV